jgi:hypothetical protein
MRGAFGVARLQKALYVTAMVLIAIAPMLLLAALAVQEMR